MKPLVRSIALIAGSAVPSLLGCAGGDSTANILVDGGEASLVDVAAFDATGDSSRIDGMGDASDAVAADATLEVSAMDAPVTDADAAASLVGIRVANWSPDAPAVDFCLADHSTGVFQGPLLANRLRPASDGATGGAVGIAFTQVSIYVLVAPAHYDLRIVVGGGAGDCSLGALVVSDATGLAMLTAGSTLTVALVGEANPVGNDPRLKLVAFVDDFVAPQPATQSDGAVNDTLALRFIHAAPGVAAVDFGTDNNGSFKAVFAGVDFGLANSAKDAGPQKFDTNGYLVQPPLTMATLRVRPSGMQDSGARDLVSASNVSAAGASVVTVALVASASTGGSPQLLECLDNSGMNLTGANPSAPYSRCMILPP